MPKVRENNEMTELDYIKREYEIALMLIHQYYDELMKDAEKPEDWLCVENTEEQV